MPPPADPSRERLEGVERIAVLRPNAIGDFVFALPALVALRAAYPRAHIVYLGRRWHGEFLEDRPSPVDETLAMPPIPGVGVPADSPSDSARTEDFVDDMRARRFDLVLQWYGGGGHANAFVQRLGARCTAGLRAEGAAPLDRWLAYEQWRNERLRLLEAAALVGAMPIDLAARLSVTPQDREQLQRHWQPPDAPIAVLQPGATDPRRRWPAERFAAIGDALADAGATVAVNGSADERALVAQVTGAMRAPVMNLCDLPLGALVACSNALMCSCRTTPGRCTWPMRWERRAWASSGCRTSSPRNRSSSASSASHFRCRPTAPSVACTTCARDARTIRATWTR